MIDSHCHLDHEPLFTNLKDVIDRSKKNGIKKILTICTTKDGYKNVLDIINFDSMIYGTFGIHPHESKNYLNINSNFIIDSIKTNEKIIGVGETGLDFFYNFSDKNIQKKSFIKHIHAAIDLNIPIIVHSRDAEKETYEILDYEKKNSGLKVLIHCFTGSETFAKKLINLGCYISVSGIITFNKSTELTKTVSNIPIENLLVETDSPYLSPIPFRGKSNEPSHIIHTVDKLSQIKNVSKDVVMKYTTNNFKKLFSLT